MNQEVINIEKVLLVKCLKHLIRLAMRETNFLDFSETLAHILNCIFSNEETKVWLDENLSNNN